MSARICALYVGQMRVGCFAKTEPDSASFLRRGGSAVPAPAGPCSRAEPSRAVGEVRARRHVPRVWDRASPLKD